MGKSTHVLSVRTFTDSYSIVWSIGQLEEVLYIVEARKIFVTSVCALAFPACLTQIEKNSAGFRCLSMETPSHLKTSSTASRGPTWRV